MSKKKSCRAGGKFTAKHSTVIPVAATVADIAAKHPLVKKISIGFITSGLSSANGHKKMTTSMDGYSLKICVRGSASHQEMHVYAPTPDMEAVRTQIEASCQKEGFIVVRH